MMPRIRGAVFIMVDPDRVRLQDRAGRRNLRHIKRPTADDAWEVYLSACAVVLLGPRRAVDEPVIPLPASRPVSIPPPPAGVSQRFQGRFPHAWTTKTHAFAPIEPSIYNASQQADEPPWGSMGEPALASRIACPE